MCRGKRILSESARGSHHGVEGSNAVANLELGDIAADRMDGAGNIVTRVGAIEVRDVDRNLPVLRVCAGDDNFDEDLVRRGCRDGNVVDFRADTVGFVVVFVDEDFLHLVGHVSGN